MEIILIILTSAIISTFFIAFFSLGYYFGQKKNREDGLSVTDHNKDAIKSMALWRQFNGHNS